MTTVDFVDVSDSQLKTLEGARDALPEGTLRTALHTMVKDLRRGEKVVLLGETDTLTPTDAARLLGLSRTHLYKILDSGALASHTVGVRDRRILATDLSDYRDRMLAAQRRTAAIFAGGSTVDDLALDEME